MNGEIVTHISHIQNEVSIIPQTKMGSVPFSTEDDALGLTPFLLSFLKTLDRYGEFVIPAKAGIKALGNDSFYRSIGALTYAKLLQKKGHLLRMQREINDVSPEFPQREINDVSPEFPTIFAYPSPLPSPLKGRGNFLIISSPPKGERIKVRGKLC